jgi:hypothetical protein
MLVFKTDLKRLAAEVKTPTDALPCNLSDEWIEQLSQDLEVVLSQEEEYPDHIVSSCLSAPLYLIGLLCSHKQEEAGNTTGEFELSTEEMFRYFEDYQMELAFEEISRKTEIKATSATLSTIFTNRRVGLRREK